MKKLMIALAVTAMAVATQAATVKWQSGTLYAATDKTGACPTSGTTGKATSYVAYLYTFDTLEAYNTAKGTAVDKLYANYVGKVTPTLSTSANAGGIANISQTTPGASTEDPITVYGMVLYVDTATAGSYADVDAFVKAGFQTGTYKNTTGLTFSGMGGQQASWTAVSAVPEPTTGLLLLLGVAGLALRRRRA